jgi:electron transfer flavoprotein alpha subunit
MTEPPRRVRRDPRAERSARAQGQVETAAAEQATAAAAAVRIIDDPAFLVLAVADAADRRLSPHDRDVIGAARALADAGGGAVLVLGWSEAIDYGAAGADRLVVATATDAETRAAIVLALVARERPRHVVFADALPGGGDVGRRVAARLGERAIGGVVAFEPGVVVRRADGGASDVRVPLPRLVLVASEAAEPVTAARHEARPLPAPTAEGAVRVRDLGPVAVDAADIPLAEADVIVAAGNGVTDWAAFHDVARALGATVGGSRAVCDAGHLPRDRQVGASGTHVAPRLYLAFGIAGAPQHLDGIARCERVVAVNTDLHAAMIKRADLAIVADAQEVMPALRHAVEARRG